MGQKIICLTMGLMFLVLAVPVEARQAGKIYRIGWLRFLSAPPTGPTHLAFRQGLREHGYVKGQNLAIEYRSAKGKPGGRPEGANELVRIKVDVIVTSPAPPLIRAAQQATHTIPIVIAGVYVDPVEAGFVESLARPGGNITGLTNIESESHAKRLEILKKSFPRISRMVIFWPRYQQEREAGEIEAAGKTLHIQIHSIVANEPLDIETVFSRISQEHPDGLLVASSALSLRHRRRIVEFTTKKRIPAIFAQSEFADAGGLLSYGADLPDLFRQAAGYVDRILKGADPAGLPVERPAKFKLVINLKAAKAMGLKIPAHLLMEADRVIE